MITPDEREDLADAVFSKGWRVVEKIFALRMGRHRAALESCSVEDLKDLQAFLSEDQAILSDIKKEVKRYDQEDKDGED
jgi:hypothetical protein